MSTFQRTPYGYRGLYRASRGFIEGVMPASTYTRMTGRLTTSINQPDPQDIRPGLKAPVVRHPRIVTAVQFIPRWKTRYSLG